MNFEIDENALSKKVKTYLEKARPGDYEHTLSVVKLLKKLLETEDGDPDILIPAAYLHDIGYAELYEERKKLTRSNWHSELQAHMQKGKELSIKILTDLNYPERLIEKIAWIVSVHDNWYTEKDYQVGILMDADNLSKLDIEHIKTKYDDPKDVVQMWEKDMPKRLKTASGKQMFSNLMRTVKTGLSSK